MNTTYQIQTGSDQPSDPDSTVPIRMSASRSFWGDSFRRASRLSNLNKATSRFHIARTDDASISNGVRRFADALAPRDAEHGRRGKIGHWSKA